MKNLCYILFVNKIYFIFMMLEMAEDALLQAYCQRDISFVAFSLLVLKSKKEQTALNIEPYKQINKSSVFE